MTDAAPDVEEPKDTRLHDLIARMNERYGDVVDEASIINHANHVLREAKRSIAHDGIDIPDGMWNVAVGDGANANGSFNLAFGDFSKAAPDEGGWYWIDYFGTRFNYRGMLEAGAQPTLQDILARGVTP